MKSEIMGFRLMLLLSFSLIVKNQLAQEDTLLADKVIGILKEQNKLLKNKDLPKKIKVNLYGSTAQVVNKCS